MDKLKVTWAQVPQLSELSQQERAQVRKALLNIEPPAQWIKKHPLYNNDYLPIDKVEYMLTSLFTDWWVEVKECKLVVNSIVVTVTLHYQIEDSWRKQDGLGASPLQVNSKDDEGKRTKPTDITQLKSNAVMLATPIAETNAVKDAADKIGKCFGRDLNRKNTLDYNATEIGSNARKALEKAELTFK